MRQFIAIVLLAGAPVSHASAPQAQLKYEAVPMWSQITGRGAPAWEMARGAVGMDGSRMYGCRRSDPSTVECEREGMVHAHRVEALLL